MKYQCKEHGELQEMEGEEPLCVDCLGEAMSEWLKGHDPVMDEDGMFCIPVEVVEVGKQHVIPLKER